MAGLELVLLARICERVGVVAVLTKLSPNQYRPCFLPPPALMTTSPSMGSLIASNSGPCTSCAIEVYPLRRLWTLVLLYTSGGSCGFKVTSDVAFSLWAKQYAWTWVQGTPPCDADCEKRKMIRNYAELSVRIKKLIHIHI